MEPSERSLSSKETGKCSCKRASNFARSPEPRFVMGSAPTTQMHSETGEDLLQMEDCGIRSERLPLRGLMEPSAAETPALPRQKHLPSQHVPQQSCPPVNALALPGPARRLQTPLSAPLVDGTERSAFGPRMAVMSPRRRAQMELGFSESAMPKGA